MFSVSACMERSYFLHFQSLFDMTYCTIHTLLLCYIRALGIYVISKKSIFDIARNSIRVDCLFYLR
ncbi:hypothetical protein BDV30DRAFT_107071 [Aspergillus minisclerotigenes]|uniref:Uncharacterized protein n=1 Tax=Aspergillus minisclerotigenes TaxID=656917 RepID=A0A5N6J7H0_9EURO|nr:hypothetical protein BDV30DRAFT_107071 [Aspergillus minisclerotigenes]